MQTHGANKNRYIAVVRPFTMKFHPYNYLAALIMNTLDTLKENRAYIQKTVEAHHAHSPRIFGSVLRREDGQDSDVDLLIEPLPAMSLLDLGAIQYELSEFLGRPVDVLTPNALPDKFRQQVMLEAVALS